jgi:inorganic pyrophosphatase/exopolyphosphatase
MASNRNKKINEVTIMEMLTTDGKSYTYTDNSKEEYKILQRQWLQMQKTKKHEEEEEVKEVEEEEKCKIKYKNEEEEDEPKAVTSGRGVLT